MKRTSLLLVGVCVLLAMPLCADDTSGGARAATADPPAAALTAATVPAPGLACGAPQGDGEEIRGIESGIGTPEALGNDAPVAADAGGIPDCPVTFSNCEDVPGRRCGLRSCLTADLGIRKCRQADGTLFNCAPANIQQTTCNCQEVLHMVCCESGTCSFGDCGVCSGGSLSIGCQ